ncbi:glucosamine/fructose-6-phosphate aminotransferase, isomerizing [Geobacter metallireducens RCH3]|uniref:Glutamine--fructose-6-phosphate aminotransferase [isomerizing] n=1 Tax=Geobacter metallireducens (strain ATCC 53774 / DSM 7210 / GS-15) TaxID=269799 RepID=Q39ZH1_GEOMG|nr:MULTISPECIES: glutamine--fructose-6-phosphate transaminase (isomerizing) [Geobacter]ABB30353.1 glutamine--fructose-6-phosphate aminotransferase [Geobacter metallireducens GS-15]EHP85018.1 glucosamine/fructose-6-phosphate aminotransferase, isomerizing [Geobacter metallireducens RCH3]MBT1073698.1 glutamine--fructose-6-phosphate transaminase (isomerizing) [Geobacter grbiciae]
MCGIVGYIGAQEATPIILDGLKRLEYRGYDSAGVCTLDAGRAKVRRSEGKLFNLERLVAAQPLLGRIGIGHTRWATHGRPSEINAHPHQAGSVIVVHNGIIENYLELRERLRGTGREFLSETDTEVISHLIDEKYGACGDFERATRQALAELRGAYAVCVLCEKEPGVLIAAKQGSPMVVGLGTGEFFVASDIPAILSHTREMVFLDDGEMVVFRDGTPSFSRVSGEPLEKASRHIDWSPLMAEKGGYKHFMLKEIFEQPRAVRDTIAGRLREEQGDVYLEDLKLTDEELRGIDRICIIACGTSWHAALVGKFLLEEHCRLPVEVDIASEFRYRNPVVNDRTLMVLISQSGETADTLAAMREGKARGARNIAICNVVDSSIAREAAGVVYTHAGPEIGVASTKAFVTQLVALYLFTIRLGRALGTLDQAKGRAMIGELVKIPALLEKTLEMNDTVEKVARRYMNARDFLYLGRGVCYPIALEGALKLKEISYIHAEGYPAGEMKHGPIALIDENMPVVVLVPKNSTYEKVLSNMEEVIARGGRVIAICSSGDDGVSQKAEETLEVPSDGEELATILLSVPLQLLAYHVAVLKGTDVDQPRNLAKSVTVE